MELLYQIALTLVPHIGDVHARILVKELGSASAVFKCRPSELEKIEGIGPFRAGQIKAFHDFSEAEKEVSFIEKHAISALFLTDPNYPQRLLNCYDPPTMIYYKGNANLNASRVLAIVGTRSNTPYGKNFTETLVRELEDKEILIVSGLAFGIDAIAHKAALQNGMPTVGVVGHGLDKIYPYENKPLAREMTAAGGGLLTEFISGTKPDRHNFPLRNRIVAGMSDATLVVETKVEGGSMITAKMADSYNRDVFALPGRTIDHASSGCNHLIKYNKAILATSADDLLQVLGWKEKKVVKKELQRSLFATLTPDQQKIVALLEEKESVHIDELNLKTGLSSSSLAAALLDLELNHQVEGMPGKRYRLV